MQKGWRGKQTGFILLFGSRNIVSQETAAPLEVACPHCGQTGMLIGKSYRPWFTLFFLPVFPVGGQQHFTECLQCHTQFLMTADELQSRLTVAEKEQSQRAIGLYNSLSISPANSVTLNELMLLYAGMKEYDQAVSAARAFPIALQNSEQCMSTLGRTYLAMDRHADAIEWFDHAIARNPYLGEAQYHKAVTCLSMNPPNFEKAVAAARAARSAGFPRADEVLKEAEKKLRGDD